MQFRIGLSTDVKIQVTINYYCRTVQSIVNSFVDDVLNHQV